MNANLDKIAQELYGKIQTRFPAIKIGDEQANVLSKKEDIPRARFFEFEYEEGGEPLGTIAITLDPADGIIVQVSGDLVNDGNDTTNHSAFKFLRSFRQFAKDRLLKFDIQNIGKSNLDKRDYQFQAKRKEPTIMENKLYGTSKISYQNLGEARLIIRHSQHINPELAAGRTMHIESIYIENADGERFKYPFKHLNGARALAEHIKHGGNPYDGIGKHVIGLSEELAQLRKFKGYVSRQPMISETMGAVTGRVIERIEEIKKEIQHLQRPAFYETFAESFEEREEDLIPEDVVNNLIDRLTVRTFNEELKAAFPFIYKLIDENELPIREVDADEILGEAMCPDCYKDPCECYNDDDERVMNEEFSEIYEFESFMEDIVCEDKDEIFSPNKTAKLRAIEKLNQVLAQELKGGPGGINAIESLKGLIDDEALNDMLRNADPNLDVRPLIQQFVIANKDKFPGNAAETLGLIKFSGDGASTPEVEPSQEPVPAAAPEVSGEIPPEVSGEIPPEVSGAIPPEAGEEVAPEVEPVAENLSRVKSAIQRACEAGAELNTVLEFGHRTMTMHDAIEECGMKVEDFGFANPEVNGLEEMLKFVSGFYNQDEKNFPLGGQRIKIKVKKGFEDGEFPNAQPGDLVKILKFIDLKDPSRGEQDDIVKLAGIKSEPRVSITPIDDKADHLGSLMQDINELHYGDVFEDIKRLAGLK